jgi:predicted nucleotidyltransferase
LADALFTATQQRVLVLLFGQPERSFFATELIHLARAGRGAVQRELKRLVESGLVTVSRVGNQKHYQANRSSPVFEELRNLVRKTVGLHEPIREALKPLSDRIRLAALYGSVAKHTDMAMSDIDLLVVSNALTLEELYATLAAVEGKLARRINPTLYTSREFDRRRKSGNAFLERVLGGEHEVLVRNDRAA